MPKVTVKDPSGADQGSVDLDQLYFGIEPNLPFLHQVVTAQLAARRAGTQSTKTRAEVRGGGAKPWKQKGTGRARQGSIRAPQWKGGGVALGPKPRSYVQRTPKKMIKLALRSALSDRAAEGKVVVVDSWGFDTPSTKSAVAALGALELTGRVVVVVGADDAAAAKSFRNLPQVHLLEPGELNAYDILCSDYIVFTRDNLPAVPADAPTKPGKAKVKAEKPAPAAKPAAAPKKAAAKPKAAAPEAEVEADTTAPGGDDDMASDLPNRPKNEGEAVKPVDPSERVKPAGEKTDPRFEAARIKSEKEAEVRAAKEAAPDAPDEPVADEAEAEAETKPSGGFSFNQITEGEGSDQ
jgi:large subunit ribosomal protein L4